MSKILTPLRWLALLLLVGLAGCNTVPQVTVEKTKYVLVQPDAEALKDCDYPGPPAPTDEYVAMDEKQREASLYNLGIDGLDEIRKCNVRWASLREWFLTQKKIYPDAPPAAKK